MQPLLCIKYFNYTEGWWKEASLGWRWVGGSALICALKRGHQQRQGQSFASGAFTHRLIIHWKCFSLGFNWQKEGAPGSLFVVSTRGCCWCWVRMGVISGWLQLRSGEHPSVWGDSRKPFPGRPWAFLDGAEKLEFGGNEWRGLVHKMSRLTLHLYFQDNTTISNYFLPYSSLNRSGN